MIECSHEEQTNHCGWVVVESYYLGDWILLANIRETHLNHSQMGSIRSYSSSIDTRLAVVMVIPYDTIQYHWNSNSTQYEMIEDVPFLDSNHTAKT